MAYDINAYKAYVDADGSIGVGALLTFDPEDLTEAQWETVSNLRDSERIEYVWAVLNHQDLRQWEEE